MIRMILVNKKESGLQESSFACRMHNYPDETVVYLHDNNALLGDIHCTGCQTVTYTLDELRLCNTTVHEGGWCLYKRIVEYHCTCFYTCGYT